MKLREITKAVVEMTRLDEAHRRMRERGVRRRRGLRGFLAIAITLLVGACATGSASLFSPAEPGSSGILSEDRDQIPAGKVMDRGFTLHTDAKVRLDYLIDDKMEIDIYFVNDDQYKRAAAGEEPTELGRDFISVHRGVVGKGTVYELLPAGRHHIVFRNLGDKTVGVRTRAAGAAHSLGT